MSSRKPIRKEKITNPGEHLEEWKKFKEQLKEHYESNPDQKIQDKDLHYWKEHADNRIASLEDEVKKAERKQKWAAGLPYAYLVVLLFVALFLGNGNLTGFVVSEQAYDSDLGGFIGYSESIGISYVDSNQYMWQPDQAGTITAVRLSGTVIGEGTARVYLADGSSKYLIYDSTGDKLALADGSAKPGWPTYAEDYNDNISAIMEYAQDSEFDTDNDGLEAENGVVDFTVENSDFGQGMADDGKCTRWEIYSEDEKESSFECYGAERCCNFIGLIPAANDWNERYYVFKGKYTATENNKVRSQLVYVSEDGWGIHSTGWMELNARFESANKITFARQCRETCDMSLASDHYFLLFELDNAAVSIDSIEYALKDDGIIAGTVVSGNQSINESYDAANASDAAEEIPEAEIVEEELEQGALDRGDVSVDGKVLEEISGNGKARVILKKKVQPSVLDFAAVLEAAIQGDTGQIKTVNFARDEFFEEMQGMEGITGFAPQDAGLLEEKIKEKKKDVADSKKAAEDVTSLLASANILKIEQETDDIIAVEIDAADLADLVASGEFSEIAVDEPVSLFIEESMALTKIADVKNTGYDGTGRKICFLDTGMNYDAFGLALNSTVFGKDFINDDDDPMDDHGHGTSVANVLLNVAPSASIYSAKVVNASGYGYESDVLAGLQYCMDQNVDVISFSIGSGMSDGFCDSNLVASLSNDAVEQGIYVASATGNDGSQTGLRVPACASKVARVAATTKQDEVAPYSNVNEIVDIFAPGSLINTIDLNGNAIVSSGTSYSAPFVAASAALLLQNESLAPAEMTYRLRSTSEVFNYSGIQRNRLSLWNALIDNVTNEPYDYSAGEANASTSVYVVQYSYVSSVVSDPILYSVADEDTGDRSWSTIATGYDPRYAAVSDNAYSRVYLGSNDVSDYLNLTHFTFTSIPSTAVVMGIEVAVERHCINTCDVFSDHTVQLLKNSVPVGDNKATGLYDWNPTTDTVVTYGSSTDLWGTSWSRSDVTNSWFGVRYAVQNGVDRQYQARVDMINITIYYNMPPTIYQQINFTNWTSAHAFNMSAAVTDVDGASDILFTNYTVNNTNVVCHPGSNSSNGNVFNVTYNCSGPALTHVKVMINFSDTAGNHIFTNYSEYIVPNLPPTITSGSVYPNTVYVGNNVTMNINTMSDPEGDGITKFWYRFYSGGLSQSNIVQDWTVLNRTNYTIQVTDAHKTIYIRAKVEDNYTNSSEYTRQVAVANSLPGHDINMSLYPLSGAYMTTTLRANCNFTDADGDSYTRYYNFYDVNDSAYRTGWTTTPTYTPSSHAANAHDNLTASCKANDGYGDSEEVYTNLTITVHMDNTAPGTPTSLSLTNPVYVGSTLTASGSGASDADSDTLSYYYDFYNVNDSTSLQSYSTDATYVLAASDAHDRIRVRVYANDTLNGGNYYEQNRTVSNSNPAMYKQNVVNHSHTSHSFIVTANVSDDDTAADIIHTSIATTSGTCTLVGNSTSGNYYGAKYNCTGTPYQSTTIRIGFKDAFDATVNSTATSHTYINHVPEVYLQNNFTNASIGHSFIVAANVSDNDTYTDIVATSIAISSGSCTLLGNSSAWRYFGVRYNCTGLGLVPASASIGFLDIAGDDINTTTSTNHYPNNAPTLLSDVTFANLSGYHGFLATANATDLDGASDIRVVAINTSNGTCDYVRNSSSLNNFGVVFNCTGKGLEIASVIVNFTDNSSEFITTSGANTYPNMAPEINPVSLNQSTFATTEEINASALAWDDDLDTLNATFYWIVNGIGRFTDTRWVIPYNTNISSVLASTGYHAFERIKVNITILDNNSYQNSTVSMEYFIYDSNAPEIGLLSQSSGYYDNITDITLSAEAQDEDGVWYAYIATNESGAWSNHTTLTNFPLGNYSDFNFTANETHITGMAYVSSKYYIIGNDTARVREINETGGFTNFNFSVAAQDTNPTGIAFINGKFYVLGNATNSVYEYNMTGNYTGFNYSVGSQDTAPLSLAYANGKMYVLGQANKRVYEYNVSGGYTGYSWNVADVETDPRGLTFVYPNFYLAGASGLSVFEFNGSGNYSGRSMNFSQHIADPQAITFGSGKFYIADSVTGLVFEYHNLSSYNSPVAVNSYPYEYSIESFIWNNHSKLNKDVVAWRIYSVDYSGNINTSAVRTFTVVTTTQGEIEMEPGSDFPYNASYVQNNITLHLNLSNIGAANMTDANMTISFSAGDWLTNLSNNFISCGNVTNGTKCSRDVTISIPGNEASGLYTVSVIGEWINPDTTSDFTLASFAMNILEHPNISVSRANVSIETQHGRSTLLANITINSTGNTVTPTIYLNADSGNLSSSYIVFSPGSGTFSLAQGTQKNVSVYANLPAGLAQGLYAVDITTVMGTLQRGNITIFVTVPEDTTWNITHDLVNGTEVDQGATDYVLGNITINNRGNTLDAYQSSDTSSYITRSPSGAFTVVNQTGNGITITATVASDDPAGTQTYSVTVFRSANFSDSITILANFSIANKPPNITNVALSDDYPEMNYGHTTISANVTDIGGVDAVWANITLPDSSFVIQVMANISDAEYELNYTPTNAGTHYVTIYANDTESNISFSSSLPFYPIETVSLYAYFNSTSETVSGITQSDGFDIDINVSVNKSGKGTGYNANTTWSLPAGWSVSPSMTTHGNLTLNETAVYSITIPPGTSAGTYAAVANVSWKNPNNSYNFSTRNITVTVSSNPQLGMAATGSQTISHNTTGTVEFYVNATGNDEVSNINLSCYSGIVCTDFTTSINESHIDLVAGENRSLSINVTVPKGYAPGTYTGQVNASSSSLNVSMELSITVPTDDNWYLSPALFNNSVGYGNIGSFGTLTIVSTGNVNLTFDTNSTNMSMAAPNVTSIFVQANSAAYITVNYTAPNTPGTHNANISIFNASSTVTTQNVTGWLSVVNFVVFLDFPQNGNAATTSSGYNLSISAVGFVDNAELLENLTWTRVTIYDVDCPIYAQDFETINCTTPSLDDGPYYDIKVWGNFTNYSAIATTTESGAVHYIDLTPPVFHNWTEPSAANGSDVMVEMNASDNVNVTNVSITVVYEDGTNFTSLMQQLGNLVTFRAILSGSVGDYDVYFTATDNASNTRNATGYYEIYIPVNITGEVTDSNGDAATASFRLLRPSNNRTLFNFTGGSYNFTSHEIHQRRYDVEIWQDTSRIFLANVSFNDSLQDFFDFDTLGLNVITEIPMYRELKGLAVSSNLSSQTGNITFNYSGMAIDDPIDVTVLGCLNWSFASGQTTCDGTWAELGNVSKDISRYTVTGQITGFSAYIAAENRCGNGNCETTYSETVSNCAVDCAASSSSSSTSSSSSSGGGGGGGGGGGSASAEPNATALQEQLNETRQQLNETKELLKDLGTAVKKLEVGLSRLEFELYQGETATTTLTLQNAQLTDTYVLLELEGDAGQFISIEDNSFTMAGKQSSSLLITVDIPKDTKAETYRGYLIVKSGGEENSIPIRIKVLEFSQLLDFRIEPLEEIVQQGDNVRIQANFINLGTERIDDITFELSLVDVQNGELIDSVEDTVSVRTTSSITKKLRTTKKTGIGDYLVQGKAKYGTGTRIDEVEATTHVAVITSQKFELPGPLKTVPIWQLIVAVVTLILMSTGTVSVYKTVQRKKRYQFKVNSALLPKKAERNVEIGRLAESMTSSYLELDKMQTHTIVAGATGSGKSVASQVIIEEALKKGIAVIVFDPTAQWSGFLRPCQEQQMLSKYAKFGMSTKQAKAFNGNIYQVNNPLEIVDAQKYAKPGEINIFSLHRLEPKDVDMFLTNTIRQIFMSTPEESPKLKLLVVYDEVHRLLPKFGGSGAGFVQVERACREFRKWGIGLVLISQVLSDFVGEIKANIGTQIQMRTADEKDLERLRVKYGEEIVRSIVKADTGTGMLENPSYNKGLPYFVSFRPLLHSVTRLGDIELARYDLYNRKIDDMRYQMEQLEAEKIDVFELKLELDLALEKLKIGKFDMVDIYLESIESRLQKYWLQLKKRPKRKQVQLAKLEDIIKLTQRDVMMRQAEQRRPSLGNSKVAKAILNNARPGRIYIIEEKGIEGSILASTAIANKGYKSILMTNKNPAMLYRQFRLQNTQMFMFNAYDRNGSITDESLERLYYSIAEVMNRNPKSVIVIDGLVGLRNHVEFRKLVMFVNYLKNAIAKKEAIILAPMSGTPLSDAEYEAMKKDADLIRPT